jgi:hypothetical protein
MCLIAYAIIDCNNNRKENVMPNWCYTTMHISGEKEELQRFLDSIETRTSDYGKTYSIIGKLYPCPQELKDTVSGFFADEKQQEELNRKEEANEAKYGAKNWYDWCCSHWGTKWGDCDTESDNDGVLELPNGTFYTDFRFQTAWGTATRAWIKISRDFPSLRFEFAHQEESDEFAGVEVIRNGEITFSQDFCPHDYGVTEPEYDSDEWYKWQEAKSEWKYSLLYELEMEAQKS